MEASANSVVKEKPKSKWLTTLITQVISVSTVAGVLAEVICPRSITPAMAYLIEFLSTIFILLWVFVVVLLGIMVVGLLYVRVVASDKSSISQEDRDKMTASFAEIPKLSTFRAKFSRGVSIGFNSTFVVCIILLGHPYDGVFLTILLLTNLILLAALINSVKALQKYFQEKAEEAKHTKAIESKVV